MHTRARAIVARVHTAMCKRERTMRARVRDASSGGLG